MLEQIFSHLRTLQRILHDYVPKHLIENPPRPGEIRYKWQQGTLMFTDLAGFTRLLEANATLGSAGAVSLLNILNDYFSRMLEIISKSGGELMEFTGDALFVFFPEDQRGNDTKKAIRAGLRMQRAMQEFAHIETPVGILSLQMRVGIHKGTFLVADIGTPRRMEHVLLGKAVQDAKLAESNGFNGRVCLSEAAYRHVEKEFEFESGRTGYYLVVDNLSETDLGEYEIVMPRRMANPVLFERSTMGLMIEIQNLLQTLEPLAAFLPSAVLDLLVENAAQRQLVPDFPEPVILFVNFIGLPELVDIALPGEETKIIHSFSRAFALINAAVEANGGMLKKITYHLSGSDIVIYFGVPTAHTDDALRAARAALEIRRIIGQLKAPTVGGREVEVYCQIGISRGSAFVAEIGEPRGRREFNVLGDTVNTTARIMNHAGRNQILINERLAQEISSQFHIQDAGLFSAKGKERPLHIYELTG
ncbi:MAG: adenylate/guanylate cyclase domain-containing protein [Anaerolineales bacterium]